MVRQTRRSGLQKKQQEAREFMRNYDSESEIFKSFLPFIAREMQLHEPATVEGRRTISDLISHMETLSVHGSVTKLMRWFSWWESFTFYRHEIWLSKMLMGIGSHKEELRRLKLSLGSWKLAPLLVTPTSFMKCQIIKRLVDPLWSVWSHRSSHCTSPDQVQADFVFLGSPYAFKPVLVLDFQCPSIG